MFFVEKCSSKPCGLLVKSTVKSAVVTLPVMVYVYSRVYTVLLEMMFDEQSDKFLCGTNRVSFLHALLVLVE